MTSIAAIVFDVDGLMVDSEPLHRRAWQELGQRYGFPILPTDAKDGLGQRVIDNLRARHAAGRIKQDPEVLIHVYHDSLNALIRRELAAKPGLETALTFVAQQGWKCGVASAGDRRYIEVILEVLGLQGWFHAIATGDEVEHGKPHPDVYLLVAQRLGVLPQACVALEDSPRGVQAAKAAGMRCIAIPEEPDAQVSHADAVCASLVEATKILQEWSLVHVQLRS